MFVICFVYIDGSTNNWPWLKLMVCFWLSFVELLINLDNSTCSPLIIVSFIGCGTFNAISSLAHFVIFGVLKWFCVPIFICTGNVIEFVVVFSACVQLVLRDTLVLLSKSDNCFPDGPVTGFVTVKSGVNVELYDGMAVGRVVVMDGTGAVDCPGGTVYDAALETFAGGVEACLPPPALIVAIRFRVLFSQGQHFNQSETYQYTS